MNGDLLFGVLSLGGALGSRLNNSVDSLLEIIILRSFTHEFLTEISKDFFFTDDGSMIQCNCLSLPNTKYM